MSSALVTPVRADHWSELWRSRSFRLGMSGVLMLYTGLALLWIFGVPLFGPADERAHVDYAWQVAHGHLPLAGPWFTPQFPELGQTTNVQHVANHPPLFYAVAGPLLRLADATGHPATGLYAIRLLNAATTFVTILVVARLAAEITARTGRGMRAAVVLTASALVAVNPALLAASGAIQNDALSILLAALVTLVLARATRTGVETRTVIHLAVLCTLGTLTRVTFITVVFVAVAWTVALTLWPALRLSRPQRATVLRATTRGLAILAVVAAGAGWFMVLNLERYGDLTGGSAVYGLETVQARDLAPGAASGPLTYLLHPYTWWTQFLQLVAPVPSLSNDTVPYMLMTAALLVVLVLAAVAAVRRRGAGLIDRPGAVTLLLLAVLFAASMAKLAVHVSNRGGANQRYLLDAIEFWAVGGAVLLLALGRLAPPAVAAVVALGATGVVTYAAGIVLRTDEIAGGPALTRLRTSLSESIVPAAELVCLAALMMVGVGLAAAVASIAQSLRASRLPVPEH